MNFSEKNSHLSDVLVIRAHEPLMEYGEEQGIGVFAERMDTSTEYCEVAEDVASYREKSSLSFWEPGQ